MNPVDVKKILDKHDGDFGELIAILEDIQAKYSYLPQQELKCIYITAGLHWHS